MVVFVELWKPKETWLRLSRIDREQYLSQLGPAVQSLLKTGVKIIAWSLNDLSTAHTTDHIYFGVYLFPTQGHSLQFEQWIEQADWYTYFDQINAKGVADTPQSIIVHMIGV